MTADLFGWPWTKFRGSPWALKYARRDLACFDAVIDRVPQKRVAVQAGGNLGLYPKRLAERFETVFTFEPAPELFLDLVANAPAANIYRYQAALGDTRGGVSLSRARRDASGRPEHEGLTHICGPGVVPTMMVDDLGLEVCDLLALDVEGWELYALRGAVETIARCRPVLTVEINKNLAFVGQTAEMVREFIAGLGYRFTERVHADETFVPLERAA